MPRSLTVRRSGLVLLLLCGACKTEIGDSCNDNLDCSTRGDRICDTAQLDGYCTVQGCSARSCPDSAICVAFYPVGFLTVPCDPEHEDAVDVAGATTDDCLPDEICLSSGLCARAAEAERFCMKSCDGSGDCRDGYECAHTGSSGAEAVPDPDRDEEIPVRRFCRQRAVVR